MDNPGINQSGRISQGIPSPTVAVTLHPVAVDYYPVTEDQLDQLVSGSRMLSTSLTTTFLGLSGALFLSWFTGCTANIGQGVIPTLAIVSACLTVGFGWHAVMEFLASRKRVQTFKLKWTPLIGQK